MQEYNAHIGIDQKTRISQKNMEFLRSIGIQKKRISNGERLWVLYPVERLDPQE